MRCRWGPRGVPVPSRAQIGTSGEYESMKSRETLIRLKKFQVDEKRRRVAQIEGMIADFQRMSVDLEREIQSEQERAGINDPTHFAYPTYAKAAIQRRENLTRSADELRIQLEDARSMLTEAFEELKKVELLDERDQARERAEESAREQADLDSIGLMRARIRAVAYTFVLTRFLYANRSPLRSKTLWIHCLAEPPNPGREVRVFSDVHR